jgi:hypothetical protein
VYVWECHFFSFSIVAFKFWSRVVEDNTEVGVVQDGSESRVGYLARVIIPLAIICLLWF